MCVYHSKHYNPRQVQISHAGMGEEEDKGFRRLYLPEQNCPEDTFASSTAAEKKKLHSSLPHLHSPITSALLRVMLIHIPQYWSLASDNFYQ